MPVSLIGKLLGWLGIPQWGLELIALGILGVLAGFGVHKWDSRIKTEEIAILQKSGQELVAKTIKQNNELAAQYNATVAANKEKSDEDAKTISDLQSADAKRLQDFNSYRRSHPEVASSSSGSNSASQGKQGYSGSSDPVEQLGSFSEDFADSTRKLISDLQVCQRDRDSLTGK